MGNSIVSACSSRRFQNKNFYKNVFQSNKSKLVGLNCTVISKLRNITHTVKLTGPFFILQVEFHNLKNLMPKSTISLLPSAKTSKNTKIPAVFFLHPVEGLVEALKPLASQLPYPVYGIECDAKAPLESMSTLSAYYIDVSL